MNFSDDQLASVLRSAPAPAAPADLRSKLLAEMPTNRAAEATRRGESNGLPPAAAPLIARDREPMGWRKWWPVGLPALGLAAFATTLIVQQDQIRMLEGQLTELRTALTTPSVDLPAGVAGVRSTVELPDERAEIARLRALVEALTADVTALEAVQGENRTLLAAINAAQRQAAPELSEARERAESIRCVNNLKQLGLAARIYATDNSDVLPADVISMKPEIATPSILVCPADPTRTAAPNWESYSEANLSYEFVGRGPEASEAQPNRVMFRCPFHGNILLCDGSVQMGLAKTHPERLEFRDGGWFLKAQVSTFVPPPGFGTRGPSGLGPANGGSVPQEAADAIAAGTPVVYQMSPELMRRYGLVPQRTAVSTNVGPESEAGAQVVAPEPAPETAPQP